MDADTPKSRRNSPGRLRWPFIGLDVMAVAGVLLLDWRVPEVLLVFWVETVVLLFLEPVRWWARGWWQGLGLGLQAFQLPAFFVAGQGFFLPPILYGFDWDQAEWDGFWWTMPETKALEGDNVNLLYIFAKALSDLPPEAVVGATALHLVALLYEWPHLQRLRKVRPAPGLGRRNPEKITSKELVIRLCAMHTMLVLGGGAVLLAGNRVGLLLLLISVKSAFDFNLFSLSDRLDDPGNGLT